MSSEHRENRPFKAIPALDALLQGMTLHVGDCTIPPETTQQVDEEVFLQSPFVLRLADDESALHKLVTEAVDSLQESPYVPSDLSLVMVAASSYLRINDALRTINLIELAEQPARLSLTAQQRPRAFQTPRSGCSVELAFCLNRQLNFQPLRAWRRWTWLARTTFGVETEVSFDGFTPLPLTEQRREELSLPKGTMRYVTIDSGLSVASLACSEDSLQLYIDEELLALMSANDRDSNSRLMQRIIFIDAISTVVHHAVREDGIFELAYADIQGSLLDKVIRMATGPSAQPSQRQVMFNLLREQPASFMAYIEKAAGLLDGARDTVGGSQ